MEKNIPYITEYGRYDDLLALMGTKCEREALAYIKKQLEADCKALEAGESASLWPSGSHLPMPPTMT